MIGRSVQARGSPSRGAAEAGPIGDTSLDDFVPHPLARKRRLRGGLGGAARTLLSELPAGMERPVLGVVLALLLILAAACLYALTISARLGRLEAELAGAALCSPLSLSSLLAPCGTATATTTSPSLQSMHRDHSEIQQYMDLAIA